MPTHNPNWTRRTNIRTTKIEWRKSTSTSPRPTLEPLPRAMAKRLARIKYCETAMFQLFKMMNNDIIRLVGVAQYILNGSKTFGQAELFLNYEVEEEHSEAEVNATRRVSKRVSV